MGTKIRALVNYTNSIISDNGLISLDGNNITGTLSPNKINNETLSNVTEFSSGVFQFDKVKKLTEDPTSLEEGLIWYNDTEEKLKVSVLDTVTNTLVVKTINLT
jgi:hypothetical protein